MPTACQSASHDFFQGLLINTLAFLETIWSNLYVNETNLGWKCEYITSYPANTKTFRELSLNASESYENIRWKCSGIIVIGKFSKHSLNICVDLSLTFTSELVHNIYILITPFSNCIGFSKIHPPYGTKKPKNYWQRTEEKKRKLTEGTPAWKCIPAMKCA